jgi:hypothetical protein
MAKHPGRRFALRARRATDAHVLLFRHDAEKSNASVRKPNGLARTGGVSLSPE